MDYYDNLGCSWRIKIEDKLESPFGGYVLKVTFSDFELEDDPALEPYLSSCPFDNLKFYGSWSPFMRPLPFFGAFCGTVHPEVIYSIDSSLYMTFNTDSSRTFRGFSINVSVVEAGVVNDYT